MGRSWGRSLFTEIAQTSRPPSLPLSSFRGCFLFLLLFLPLHNGAPHGNNSLHVRAGPLHSSPVGLIPGNRKGFWQGPLFPECVNEGGKGEGAFGVAKSEGRGQDWAKIKILRALLPRAFYFSLFRGAAVSFSGKVSYKLLVANKQNHSFLKRCRSRPQQTKRRTSIL